MQAPPHAWGLTDAAPENLGEMGLIRQSASNRDLAQRLACRGHHFLRAFAPQADEVRMRRFAKALLEGPTEMACTQRDELGESLDAYRLFEVLNQVGFNPPLLPRRKTAARVGRDRGRDFAAVKDRGKARNALLCGTRIVCE